MIRDIHYMITRHEVLIPNIQFISCDLDRQSLFFSLFPSFARSCSVEMLQEQSSRIHSSLEPFTRASCKHCKGSTNVRLKQPHAKDINVGAITKSKQVTIASNFSTLQSETIATSQLHAKELH